MLHCICPSMMNLIMMAKYVNKFDCCSVQCIKLQYFQFRIIHRIHPVNEYSFKKKLKNLHMAF